MSSDKVYTDHVCNLLPNVHTCLPSQPGEALCKGQYQYYHYGCDGLDDQGWGCGYRTLQTICSWIRNQNFTVTTAPDTLQDIPVPSITQIQQVLVDIGDKPDSFVGSRQWIGSFEACLTLDQMYQIPCKILHIEKGSDIHQFLPELYQHFTTVGAPVMMGGETDHSSKGIMGVRLVDPALLVVDPHYYGERPTLEILMSSYYVRWMPVSELHSDTFYNMCLPTEPLQ